MLPVLFLFFYLECKPPTTPTPPQIRHKEIYATTPLKKPNQIESFSCEKRRMDGWIPIRYTQGRRIHHKERWICHSNRCCWGLSSDVIIRNNRRPFQSKFSLSSSQHVKIKRERNRNNKFVISAFFYRMTENHFRFKPYVSIAPKKLFFFFLNRYCLFWGLSISYLFLMRWNRERVKGGIYYVYNNTRMFKQFQWDEGGDRKMFFSSFLLLFPWRNKWVFFSQDFFFPKGRRRRSTDIPFRNNRENRREKKKKSYATHTRRGAISIKLFPTHNKPPSRLKGGRKKKRNRTPVFSNISNPKDLGTFFGKFVWKSHLPWQNVQVRVKGGLV